MRRRSRHLDDNEDLNIWPAFTDLMSNAFMILSLFLLLAIVKASILQSTSEEIIDKLRQSEDRVGDLEKQLANLQQQLQQKKNQVTNLEGQVERLKSPPIIVIKDSGEYKFEVGKADLPTGLRSKIENDFVNQIERYATEYQGYIVEVIGHTDGQKNSNRYSSLDDKIEGIANGENASAIQLGSNADLGLMRALAVVQVLRDMQKKGRLKGLEFRAYSAAQLVLPKGYIPQNDGNTDEPARRRIEIRFTPPGVER
ncbi:MULTISPECIES: hypothetical protein [Aerosakkonema]|uniref:hypothetical protein n=1 Tax=Aerosakkonema TaxID=1246629 RepID=UPI0035B92E97